MTEDAAEVGREVARTVEGVTFTGRFRDTVESHGKRVALRWRNGGEWRSWTWNDYRDQACRFAGGLRAMGVRPGDRVVVMMGNRPEFHAVDMGTLIAGATPISLYDTSSPEQVAYMTNHSGATVAVAGDPADLERFLKVRPGLETLRALVAADGHEAGDGVLSYADVMDSQPLDLDEAAGRARPDDPVTLLYTSGTTGLPKGVMHSHRNIAWTLESMRRAMGTGMAGWRLVSYLPMAHVSERIFGRYMHVTYGTEITICPSVSAVDSYLVDTRPHCFASVPRIWEKLRARLLDVIASTPDRAREIDEAMELGLRLNTLRTTGRQIPSTLRESWERAEAEVLAPIKATIGMDACEWAFTGSAPIPRHVFDFFLSLGIPLMELYGMSESPVATGWSTTAVRPGTVGRPTPGVELRLAPDREVLLRGGQLSPGYFRDPERTAEAFDADGWLHSGDLGEADEDGYLRIIGRKKELIITSGGKNISPVAIEGPLKRIPFIAHAVVAGDGRPYLTALLVLDPAAVTAWAEQRSMPAGDPGSIAAHPDFRAELDRGVQEVNRTLSRPEQIKKYVIVDDQWSPATGELTATMKLRRAAILARYTDVIGKLYDG